MNIILTDDLGIQHHFTAPPQRVISLVPSQTELLDDLGLEEYIVGITKFCIHPESLRSKKIVVGGTKKVSFEKIMKLNPDFIIANKEENTPEMVTELEKIAPVWVTNIVTMDDNYRMISNFGKIFRCEEKAERLNREIEIELHHFSKGLKPNQQIKTAYLIWKNPYMAVGKNTFINEMLQINNFKNVFETDDRYPEFDLEKLREKDPKLILLSSEPYPFKEKDTAEIQREFPSAQVILVDGEMFSWYGSRTFIAFKYFKKLQETLSDK